MNQRVQKQVDKFKQVTVQVNTEKMTVSRASTQRQDGLSMAIRSKKDADNFIADLKAAVQKAKHK